jgi:intracellular septation protein
LIVYASGSVRTAAGVGVAAGLVQFGRLYFAARRIDLMQWSSLALAMVLGGAAILTRNPRFVMVKPSIVHLAIAAAMLRRSWMIRYVTPIARQNVPETTMVAAGYAWAMLMAALGFANLVIAMYFAFATWAWFVGVAAVGAKLGAVAMQFAVFRTIVRRRLAQSAV